MALKRSTTRFKPISENEDTMLKFWILQYIVDKGAVSAATIATGLNQTLTDVLNCLDELEQEGSITRVYDTLYWLKR